MNKLVVGLWTAAASVALAAAAMAQTRGVTATEVTFGMPTDLSGPAATYGVSSSNGVKMRFDEVNEAGGIFGSKLINRDKVFAFVGALGTPMNNACFKDQFAATVSILDALLIAPSM